MSLRVKMIIPAVLMLFTLGYAATAVIRQARAVKQALPQAVGELAVVKSVEVRDAGGPLILNGNITFRNERDGDVKGVAILTATGAITGANGKAEIEVSLGQSGIRRQELEVEMKNLAAGATYNLYVDGLQVATFSADRRGAAELELTNEFSR